MATLITVSFRMATNVETSRRLMTRLLRAAWGSEAVSSDAPAVTGRGDSVADVMVRASSEPTVYS
jgi:hypothetical protein